MKKHLTPITLFSLLGFFILIIFEVFVPSIRNLMGGSELFLVPFVISSLLGLVLIYSTIKEKREGLFKIFLLLTGFSIVGIFLSVFLHNAFYALGIITNDVFILNYLMQIFAAGFFIIGIFICPLGFLVGLIGSITLFIKKR